MDLDFEKDLVINKYKLDEECVSHPSKFGYYAELQTEAKGKLSKAKDVYELVCSEANLRIRKEYEESGKKVTEAIINSAITLDESVKKAKEHIRECESVYNTLSVAVIALENKRSELDNLVKLYCAGYFSNFVGENKTTTTVENVVQSDIRKKLNRGE